MYLTKEYLIKEIVKELVREHYSYLKECENNLTNIHKDTATIKAKSMELQAYRELASEYFKYQLKEREQLFKLASNILDLAIQNGDIELAEISISTINIVTNKSPFTF